MGEFAVAGAGNHKSCTKFDGTPPRRAIWRFLSIALLIVAASLVRVADVSARELLLPRGAETLAKSSGLTSLKAAAKKAGKVRVIVGLRVPFSAEGRLKAETARAQRREIASAVSSVKGRFSKIAKRNPKAVRSYDSLPFIAMELTPEELDGLAADSSVISITEDRILKPTLAQSAPLIGADKAWAASYSGLGQTIAIVDTGVDKNHPFLAGKVVSEACYSILGTCPGGVTASTAAGSGMPCPYYDCSHGTHVAGIAAGLGSSFSGVARNASIIAIQVFSYSYGTLGAYYSDLLAAMERIYALRNDFKIAAVNLSLGGGAYSASCDNAEPAFKAAVDNLASVGIATIAASGNSYDTSEISYPACISSAVSVGAVSDASWGSCGGQSTQADKVACYSNSASILSLLAPGSYINSSVPGGQYMNFHGTSMATPHVAGAWAVIRQKAPTASVSEILALLKDTGKSVTDYRNNVVKKRINVKAALDALGGGNSQQTLQYTKLGGAGGTVSFNPAGTLSSCSSSCANSYDTGTVVTLSAEPAAGSVFLGWSGACSGTGNCSVLMSQAVTAVAEFSVKPQSQQPEKLSLQYNKLGLGNGTVSFAPAGTLALCSSSCSNSFDAGTAVTLTAAPADDAVFLGWSGVCSGTGTCAVAMAQAVTVSAEFSVKPQTQEPEKLALQYNKLGAGSGTVSFAPAGSLASCSESCSSSFAPGTVVTVTAAAAAGSAFLEWAGACSGTGSCTVTMSQAATLNARFVAASDRTLTYSKLGTGSGNVAIASPAGIANCATSCLTSHGANALVTLKAQAAYGSAFGGWSGACKGRAAVCKVRMRSAASVRAVFNVLPLQQMLLSMAGNGSGSVSVSAPDGVSTCGKQCSMSYPSGTRVRLSATAAPGMVFAGWTGACRGKSATCSVTLRSARTVTAAFSTP